MDRKKTVKGKRIEALKAGKPLGEPRPDLTTPRKEVGGDGEFTGEYLTGEHVKYQGQETYLTPAMHNHEAEMPFKRLLEQEIKSRNKLIHGPSVGPSGVNTFNSSLKGSKAEDITRVGTNLIYWFGREKAVTIDDVRERLYEFFYRCISRGEVLTLEKMALALGWSSGKLVSAHNGGEYDHPMLKELLDSAYQVLASYDAEMAVEGNINSAVYIFRAKNYFGMKDEVEHVITPNNPLGDIRSPEDIRKRLGGVADDPDDFGGPSRDVEDV